MSEDCIEWDELRLKITDFLQLKCYFGLHIFQSWTLHFSFWTQHFGWTPRLKSTLPQPTFLFPLETPLRLSRNMLHGWKDNSMLAKPLAACTYLSSTVSQLFEPQVQKRQPAFRPSCGMSTPWRWTMDIAPTTSLKDGTIVCGTLSVITIRICGVLSRLCRSTLRRRQQYYCNMSSAIWSLSIGRQTQESPSSPVPTARGRNTSSGGFPSCCGSWRALCVRMIELTYVTARTVGTWIVFWFFDRPTYCKQ